MEREDRCGRDKFKKVRSQKYEMTSSLILKKSKKIWLQHGVRILGLF